MTTTDPGTISWLGCSSTQIQESLGDRRVRSRSTRSSRPVHQRPHSAATSRPSCGATTPAATRTRSRVVVQRHARPAPPNFVNFGRINDPEIDRLFDEGRRETDPAARAEAYQEIGRSSPSRPTTSGAGTRCGPSPPPPTSTACSRRRCPTASEPVIIASVQPSSALAGSRERGRTAATRGRSWTRTRRRRLRHWGLTALGFLVLICLFAFVSTAAGMLVLGVAGRDRRRGVRRVAPPAHDRPRLVLVTFFSSPLIRFLPGDPGLDIIPSSTPESSADSGRSSASTSTSSSSTRNFLHDFVTATPATTRRSRHDLRSERSRTGSATRSRVSLQLMFYAQFLALLDRDPARDPRRLQGRHVVSTRSRTSSAFGARCRSRTSCSRSS